MQEVLDFRSWLLDNIRSDCKKWANDRQWLEVARNIWADTSLPSIKHILDGGALLLATDERRDWFISYALARFHSSSKPRPILPVLSLKSLFPAHFVLQKENMENIRNMLKIAYKDYMFWYVGRSDTIMADLCMGRGNGLFWVLNEGVRQSFVLKESDEFLDYKLIEMLQLFEKSLYASVLGKVILE